MAQEGSRQNPWIKDPNDVDNFSVTWADRLGADTIATSAWSVVSGTVVINTNTSTTTVASVMLSGGAAGEKATLLNRVTSAAGRTLDRTVYVKIKQT